MLLNINRKKRGVKFAKASTDFRCSLNARAFAIKIAAFRFRVSIFALEYHYIQKSGILFFFLFFTNPGICNAVKTKYGLSAINGYYFILAAEWMFFRTWSERKKKTEKTRAPLRDIRHVCLSRDSKLSSSSLRLSCVTYKPRIWGARNMSTGWVNVSNSRF